VQEVGDAATTQRRWETREAKAVQRRDREENRLWLLISHQHGSRLRNFPGTQNRPERDAAEPALTANHGIDLAGDILGLLVNFSPGVTPKYDSASFRE
jgi:hypothetical protein